MSVDAISLGIQWDRLISIADEIINSLVRSSFSTNVRESYDLSCVVFDSQRPRHRAGHLQRAVLHRHRACNAGAQCCAALSADYAEAGRRGDDQRSVDRHRPPLRHQRDAAGVPQRTHRRLLDEHHAPARHRRRRIFGDGARGLSRKACGCRCACWRARARSNEPLLELDPRERARARADARRPPGQRRLHHRRRAHAQRVHGRVPARHHRPAGRRDPRALRAGDPRGDRTAA